MTSPARPRNSPVPTEPGAPESGAGSPLTAATCSLAGHTPPASPRTVALAVQVSFEPSRVAAACLAVAYEQVVPYRQRTTGSRAPVPSASVPLHRPHSGESRR